MITHLAETEMEEKVSPLQQKLTGSGGRSLLPIRGKQWGGEETLLIITLTPAVFNKISPVVSLSSVRAVFSAVYIHLVPISYKATYGFLKVIVMWEGNSNMVNPKEKQ